MSSTLKPRVGSAKTGDSLSASRRHSLSVSPNVRSLHERKLSPGRSYSKSDENVTRGRPLAGRSNLKASKSESTSNGDINAAGDSISSKIEIHVTDENDIETEVDPDEDAARLAQRRSKGRSSSLPNGILRNHLKPPTPLLDISENDVPEHEQKGRRGRRVSFSVPMDEKGCSETGCSPPVAADDRKGLSKLQVQADRDPLPTGSSLFQQVMAEVIPPKDSEDETSPEHSPKRKEKIKTLHITKKDKRRQNPHYNH